MSLLTQGSVAAHECSIGLGCGDSGSRVQARGSPQRRQVGAGVINQICFSSVPVTETTRNFTRDTSLRVLNRTQPVELLLFIHGINSSIRPVHPFIVSGNAEEEVFTPSNSRS